MDHRYRPQVRQVKKRRSLKREERDEYGSPSRSSTECESCRSATSDDNRRKQSGELDHIAGDAEPLLPGHIQDLILHRLPARQRCRMRCVCNAWTVPPAPRAVQDSPQQELWFVMARPPKYDRSRSRSRHTPKYGKNVAWRFRAYSSCSLDMNKRGEGEKPFFRPPLPNPHHSKLSSLLGTGCNFSRVPHARQGEHHGSPLVHALFLCSAGGLMSAVVLRSGAKDYCYDFIVFNCLTGCVKVLPPPLNPGKLSMAGSVLCGSLHMTLDSQDPSCYYIFLTNFRTPEYFEVFESRRARWKVVCINPYVLFESVQLMRDFVVTHSSSELSVVDADFWCLEWVEGNRYDRVLGDFERCLLGYHARHDTWTSLLLSSVPHEFEGYGCIKLVKHKSKLLLGEILLGADDDAILGFGVWELKPTSVETGTWVEVARTPEHLCPTDVNARDWRAHLSADGGLFWMTLCKEDDHRSFRPPLVFDMARDSWYSLPLTRSSRKFGCILVHRPSFSASV